MSLIRRGSEKIRAFYKKHPYAVRIGGNGKKYVPIKTVACDQLNTSMQNKKTGKVIAFNLPVELTCDHKCECYSLADCYACGGCYQFSNNQAEYSENLNYFNNHTAEEFINAMIDIIKSHPSRSLFRWFTCGDIVNVKFLYCMVEIAKRCENIRFWTYTKKYGIVNTYVAQYGLESIPENLHIIFSHWMNRDGSYYPMYNPHNFPVSEFIPYGREDLLSNVTHVCPCSDPTKFEHCENCKTPCYELKHGESMGLVEHSTPRTKARDTAIKALKAAGTKIDNLIDFLKSFIG